jgi:hypothetical protein
MDVTKKVDITVRLRHPASDHHLILHFVDEKTYDDWAPYLRAFNLLLDSAAKTLKGGK